MLRSQKNSDLKHCIKCGVLLTNENWLSYLKPRSNYICTSCFREYGKTHHKTDPNYSKKQSARYHIRKSAVIFSYGHECVQCGEDDYDKLTIDHIHGSDQRHKNSGGSNLYEQLYNNVVDRDRYQVLCYNCNCSKNVQYKDKYSLRNKKIVMDKYGGGFCQECGENRIERLTVDHKNNDGAKQRKRLGCGTGSKMYKWLIKNNFPDNLRLQVLCYNCNCSKIAFAKQMSIEQDYNLAGSNALKASVLDGSTSESAVS